MSERCLCGREGCMMPEPMMNASSQAIERWIDQQWLTLAKLQTTDNTMEMVEARRRVSRYLMDHGWSASQVGRYLKRNHSTILKLVKR
jgi:Helix-turn-helix domain